MKWACGLRWTGPEPESFGLPESAAHSTDRWLVEQRVQEPLALGGGERAGGFQQVVGQHRGLALGQENPCMIRFFARFPVRFLKRLEVDDQVGAQVLRRPAHQYAYVFFPLHRHCFTHSSGAAGSEGKILANSYPPGPNGAVGRRAD
ncbi:hypothetical protein SPHV1_2260111 [Novosphingobium sp. KN65.2]|nr:hypothetical protein SPHV1_2260111 [Novosphingobium sp. KN65.2]